MIKDLMFLERDSHEENGNESEGNWWNEPTSEEINRSLIELEKRESKLIGLDREEKKIQEELVEFKDSMSFMISINPWCEREKVQNLSDTIAIREKRLKEINDERTDLTERQETEEEKDEQW